MRRFSKIAAVVLVGAVALTGCGKSGSTSTSSSSASSDICKGSKGSGPKVGVAYDVGGRGDQSFNDSAYRGLEKVVKDLKASCIEAKATPNDNDQIREQRLQTLADQGYNPVISVGFLYSPAAAKVAQDNPKTDFAVIDGYASTLTKSPLKNLSDLTFAENEGSYLVGVAAALKTKSKHVGFVGGTHGDLIKKFEAGYVAGVKSVDPSIKVDVQYLTEDQNDSATGFENPAGGKAAAQAMYQSGADIVYHAAGKSGLGVFQAAAAAGQGKWAIGVDSDQYLSAQKDQKSHILTSMVKRVDTAVFKYVQAFADKKPQSGFVTYDLKANGVGYSTSGGFIDDIKPKIEAAAQQIESGQIKVPTDPAKVK